MFTQISQISQTHTRYRLCVPSGTQTLGYADCREREQCGLL